MDPFSIAMGVGGLVQSIVGGVKARKAQKQMEKMLENTPKYTANQSILDYYNKALARYNVSPTDTAMYKAQQRDIGRGVATGLNYLQDRRSALAGTSSILRAANDASLNANVAAEKRRDALFGELGTAAGMKAQEQTKAFQQNELYPFEAKYNLKAQKAGAANQLVNAGLQNIWGGLQGLQQSNILGKGGSGGSGGGGGFWNSQFGKLYQ